LGPLISLNPENMTMKHHTTVRMNDGLTDFAPVESKAVRTEEWRKGR
jgi:hypothetical protein